ncbi:NUMOD4 domain-containing protein [Providencia rettgeri]
MSNQFTDKHYDTNSQIEEWLPVPIQNFSESYEVSSLGRVRSLDRCTTGSILKMKVKGRLLKPRMRKDGYLTVNFSFNNRGSQFAIHRLIALAFIKNASDLPYVNHKNGIKTDNRAENLEWVTPLGNIKHAIDSGLMTVARGADNEQFKGTIIATNTETLNAIKFHGKKSLVEFGFDHSAVYSCISGRTKSHRGYTFRRVQGNLETAVC